MARILIVDDSRNIREFCRRELEREGYAVTAVATGEEAISECRTRRPDVAVLDIHLPGIDGIETAGRIAGEELGVTVIFYTAYADRVAHDLRSWAGVECVEKSETLTELKAAIARVLTGRKETASEHPARGRRSGLGGRREAL